MLILLSFISIYFIIKYSDYPFINLPFNLDRFFIKPKNTDDIILNFAIGYIVSFIFYLIVIYFPEKVKKSKVEKIAFEELSSICTDAIMLVILMYKNVCKTEEWDFKHLKDDAEFFDAHFYEKMRLFDAYKNADTLICKVDDNGNYNSISWDDKLEKDLNNFVSRIDQVITRYIYFLDDEIIDKALLFKNTNLFTSYLGLPSMKLGLIYTGNNGVKYSDRVSLYMIRKDPKGMKTPLFTKSISVENTNMLSDFIKDLLSLRKLCSKKSTIKRNIAIENYCFNNCGQCGIAIFNG